MKLNLNFVKYLFLTDEVMPKTGKKRKAFRAQFGEAEDSWDGYAGSADESRAIGAYLIAYSDLEGDEAIELTEVVLEALKKHRDEFSASNWGVDRAFAGAIKKLNCAEGAFKAMAETADDPVARFKDLLNELAKLGVSMPTEEGWAELKPKKEEPKPASKNKGKKTK